MKNTNLTTENFSTAILRSSSNHASVNMSFTFADRAQTEEQRYVRKNIENMM